MYRQFIFKTPFNSPPLVQADLNKLFPNCQSIAALASMARRKAIRPMNESKYPKSLSILLALNLCFLLTMLITSMDEIGDGAKFVTGMTGLQSIVLALGLGLIALPKAKGMRRGMLGILGMAIVAPVIISLCGQVLAEARFMDKTEERIFTLLSFYSTAIPILIMGMVVVHEGC